ncbi:methyltransferase domain-containing protein [Candidatus Saccharibacteria bacterium]|nr:methyltransferase domain-containing protein [Candidatus Saccharibacteria bacterium]
MPSFSAKSICILGRQPALGLAELECVYGAEHIQPLGDHALLDIPAGDINFKRLGGSLKVARLLAVLDSSDWPSAYDYLANNVPRHLPHLPPGGLTLGVSVYGLDVNPRKLSADLLSLKRIIRAAGRSARIVPNKSLQLNAAQVLHNNLTKRGAWELLLVRHLKQTYIGQTFFVQDIDAYAARDQARPKRDARIGMLPPKLGQIIINLAAPVTINKKQEAKSILDPFCGTGVILQEALLMGYEAIGSDIEPRMVEYAQANLDWLGPKFELQTSSFKLYQGDATNHKWSDKFDVIASEIWLGRPFTAPPPPAILQQNINDVNTILKKFLSNLRGQVPAGFRMCLAVPAWPRGIGNAGSPAASIPRGWQIANLTHRLPLLERLTDVGYNRIALKHVGFDELIYARPNQIVARELVIMERI